MGGIRGLTTFRKNVVQVRVSEDTPGKKSYTLLHPDNASQEQIKLALQKLDQGHGAYKAKLIEDKNGNQIYELSTSNLVLLRHIKHGFEAVGKALTGEPTGRSQRKLDGVHIVKGLVDDTFGEGVYEIAKEKASKEVNTLANPTQTPSTQQEKDAQDKAVKLQKKFTKTTDKAFHRLGERIFEQAMSVEQAAPPPEEVVIEQIIHNPDPQPLSEEKLKELDDGDVTTSLSPEEYGDSAQSETDEDLRELEVLKKASSPLQAKLGVLSEGEDLGTQAAQALLEKLQGEKQQAETVYNNAVWQLSSSYPESFLNKILDPQKESFLQKITGKNYTLETVQNMLKATLEEAQKTEAAKQVGEAKKVRQGELNTIKEGGSVAKAKASLLQERKVIFAKAWEKMLSEVTQHANALGFTENFVTQVKQHREEEVRSTFENDFLNKFFFLEKTPDLTSAQETLKNYFSTQKTEILNRLPPTKKQQSFTSAAECLKAHAEEIKARYDVFLKLKAEQNTVLESLQGGLNQIITEQTQALEKVFSEVLNTYNPSEEQLQAAQETFLEITQKTQEQIVERIDQAMLEVFNQRIERLFVKEQLYEIVQNAEDKKLFFKRIKEKFLSSQKEVGLNHRLFRSVLEALKSEREQRGDGYTQTARIKFAAEESQGTSAVPVDVKINLFTNILEKDFDDEYFENLFMNNSAHLTVQTPRSPAGTIKREKTVAELRSEQTSRTKARSERPLDQQKTNPVSTGQVAQLKGDFSKRVKIASKAGQPGTPRPLEPQNKKPDTPRSDGNIDDRAKTFGKTVRQKNASTPASFPSIKEKEEPTGTDNE